MGLRMVAFVFGIAFLAGGIAWHLPFLFSDHLLLGFFQVDSLHNKVHIASGLLALTAAATSARWSRRYLKIFGGIYALLGILGFMLQDEFMAMQINRADNVLHAVIGLLAVIMAFKLKIPAGE